MPAVTELRNAVAHARLCLESDDFTGARTQLERALPDLQSARSAPNDAIAEAATVYASILGTCGEAALAVPWAELAHQTYRRLSGPPTHASVRAASVLGQVLTSVGDHDRAVDVYAELVRVLPAHLGAEHPQVFRGQADYAAALHRVGRCGFARRLLEDGWRAHEAVFGSADRDGIKLLARLAVMTRDCGDFDRAHEFFGEARARCRAYLPADDPLTDNMSRLVRAEPDRMHKCRPEGGPTLVKPTFGRRLRWPSR